MCSCDKFEPKNSPTGLRPIAQALPTKEATLVFRELILTTPMELRQ